MVIYYIEHVFRYNASMSRRLLSQTIRNALPKNYFETIINIKINIYSTPMYHWFVIKSTSSPLPILFIIVILLLFILSRAKEMFLVKLVSVKWFVYCSSNPRVLASVAIYYRRGLIEFSVKLKYYYLTRFTRRAGVLSVWLFWTGEKTEIRF